MSAKKSERHASVFCTYFVVGHDKSFPSQTELEKAWDEYRKRGFDKIEVEYISTSEFENADD